MKIWLRILCSLTILGLATLCGGQTIEDPSVLIAGQWEAVPLAERSQLVPDSKDTYYLRFKGVGMTKTSNATHFNVPDSGSWYITDNGMVVFWAGVERQRVTGQGADPTTSTSPEKRSRLLELMKRIDGKTAGYEWALFSIKDGKVTKICTDGVSLALPGEPKGFIRRSTSRIVPMKDKVLLFFDNRQPFFTMHGYVAWDGHKFSEFLHADQTVTTSEGDFEVKEVDDLGRTQDGNVWILLAAKNTKGRQYMYWTYDGATFSPVLSTKGKWPGTQYDAKINSFFPEQFFLSSGVLLPADGGNFSGSVLKIHHSKTEELLKSKTVLSLLGVKNICRTFRMSNASTVDVFTLVALAKKETFGSYCHASLLFYNNGKLEKVFDKEMVDVEKDKQFWINDGYFLSGSPIAYVFSAGSQWTEPFVRDYERVLQSARLYSYDGTTVTNLAKGLIVEPDSMRLQKTPRGQVVTLESRDEYRLISVKTGADGKMKIDLADDDNKRLFGIVSMGPNGAKFSSSPKFTLINPGPEITLSDVVGWINDREVIALCESGIYQLKRNAQTETPPSQ